MPTILPDLSSKGQRSKGGEGRKGRREERGDRKKAKTRNKSNINLKLSNFKYLRNCFLDFSNKLQINAAKSTCDQTSSDKAPVTAKLVKEVLSTLTSEQPHFLTILLTILFVHVLAKQIKYFPINFNSYKFQYFMFYFQENMFYA